MTVLPSGTVTVLFTDIEGSTRLLEEHGDAYAEMLERHRRVLRDAYGRHGGVEVDTQGDAFFVAFARASDAVAAALEAQRKLELPVRMGIHTGEPQLVDGSYVGIDVHRGARICAVGHGGQVLVSAATQRLLDGVELRDLGLHRLKDVGELRLYQLGSEDFPPLRSLNQTNLPLRGQPLLGRSQELADLVRLVQIERARLVTLTGPGGIGKTTLAVAAAAELVERFRDGVWFAELSALRDADLVLPTIAGALGTTLELPDHVGDKALLVVVDNFEQVVDAAAELGTLLESCPNLQLIVTSREPLQVRGERRYPLQPLPESPAVELFRRRAESVDPGFAASYEELARICELLDNLPLALELAAARTVTLRPEQLLGRLKERLPLLASRARDVPERQRTLRAAIEWSYDLLEPEERALFARLAVFAGGFTLEAAEEVCDGDLDTLESLVDKSLVRQGGDGRFYMLETIREYAAERFDVAVDSADVRHRHADSVVRAAERAEAQHHEGYKVLEAEHDNARAALEFLCAAHDAESALRLAVAFGDYWLVRGHVAEGLRRMEAALALPAATPRELHRDALIRASMLACVAGDTDVASTHASAAVVLAREVRDGPALGVALAVLGDAYVSAGEYDRGASIYEEALQVAHEDDHARVRILTNLSDAALACGDAERAIDYSRQAAEHATGPDRDTVRAIAAFNTGSALIQLGRPNESRPYLRDALEAVVTLDYPELLGWCLAATAASAATTAAREAGVLLGAADAAMERAGAAFAPAEQRLRQIVLWELRAGDFPETDDLLDEGRSLADDDAVELARQFLG